MVLADEINARWPNRDKASDGTIGDAAHASRKSDHNPWVVVGGYGVVRARDIDEDLDGNGANGANDAAALFEHLLALAKAGDPRLNGGGYLIYEGRIYSERGNWASRPYTGPNAHKHHIHVSFSRNQAGFDSTAPWGIWPISTPDAPQEDVLMAVTEQEFDDLVGKVDKIVSYLEGKELKSKGDMLTRIRNGVADIDAKVK